MNKQKILILCAGMQSSGTTLISWCFLQRPDTDGVLDMENSVIETAFDGITSPYIWVKMTIGSFRWFDVACIYKDLRYNVKPLLVIRDVRDIYASLVTKEYGNNGTTAEDPPIRMRFRRFKEDWERFAENGWPVVKYEDFILDAPGVLKEYIGKLELPWTDHMLVWHKNLEDLAFPGIGNETFHRTLGYEKRLDKILLQNTKPDTSNIPVREIDWLEREFQEYNRINGYAMEADRGLYSDQAVSLPDFNVTRRMKWNNNWSRVERLIVKTEELKSYKNFYHRITNHRVLGYLLRFWSKYINPSLKIE